MTTASVLSKKSPVQRSIDIKSSAAINTTGVFAKTTSKSDFKNSEEKALVIHMFQRGKEKESCKTEFTYTLTSKDHKRLNSKGILTVYDLSKPINIPVIKLLGEWKKTHAGITLIQIDEKWRIKGQAFTNATYKPKPSYSLFMRLLRSSSHRLFSSLFHLILTKSI